MVRLGDEVRLGHVTAPSGRLVVLDLELTRYWEHGASYGRNGGADLMLVGPDAERAGIAYDDSHHPIFLFDVDDAERAAAEFDEFARERGFEARARALPRRITPRARVDLGLETSPVSVVEYEGLWGVALGGLPTDQPMEVIGYASSDRESATGWARLDLVVDPEREPSRSVTLRGVSIDSGQFLFADLVALDDFRGCVSLDGLADVAFWGEHAAALARALDAEQLDELSWGWRDATRSQAEAHYFRLREAMGRLELPVETRLRPHGHDEELARQLRSGAGRTGSILLDGARVLATDMRSGEGLYDVTVWTDDTGQVVRLEVPLQQHAASTGRTQGTALVSLRVLEGGEPIRLVSRSRPHRDGDSGWWIYAGSETQDEFSADSMRVVPLAELIANAPALEPLLDRDPPAGSIFVWDGTAFVPHRRG